MKTKVFLSIVLTVLISVGALAQENEKRFGVELNGDVSFVSSDLAGASLNSGLGFEAILQYRFMPFTSVYGGWGYSHFNANESFAGPDTDFEQTGYILGLQL
ncbi:MAG: porin family protein [Mariniphaga sp.]|nr:porin family protein [Mariniphaga sp.]